ncbi:MAG: serine protein kinase, partial [Acidobacteriota bacterium]
MFNNIAKSQDQARFKTQNWTGSFEEYLAIVQARPEVTRTAYQRLHDMIMSHGTEKYIDSKKEVIRYRFFDDPIDDGKDAVFGLDVPLMKLVSVFNAAAQGYGAERRVLLLHGPVGSAKSTVARVLKKGVEAYSKTDEGALYSYSWVPESKHGNAAPIFDAETPCPMNSDPLTLIPRDIRREVLDQLQGDSDFRIPLGGEMSPLCRFFYKELGKKYDGDWTKIVSHVKVRRLIISEMDRVGIGTFQPKDEKNQDSTELTGDINYRKIAQYGTDSDPRAFNFDGEFNVANRGIVEFIEVLKLDVAFLYDLLGASQEHKIKPKKFAATDIDEVIIGHTNEPEYLRLQNNEFMEALRDRTIKIDVPYVTKLDEELRIYERDFNSRKTPGKLIAPHTLEVAAMWAVLTRLEEPKKADLTLMQKMKLYNGQLLEGYTEDNVKELRKEAKHEGLDGISPRYVQDKISNALVVDTTGGCVNPFMVMNELESGLKNHSLISNEDTKTRYRELLAEVRREYEDIVKNEVQRAISADEGAIGKLCGNYIDNVKAYTQRERVKNKYTGQYEEPDERLMRAIEEKASIAENRKDDFRREIMNYIGALAIEGKVFDYKTNDRLRKALELKLFEDQKDSIKLTSLVSSVVDEDTQEKIDVVSARLRRDHGYCEVCAADVLS